MRFTQEQYEHAQRASLLDYLRRRGHVFTREGHRYRDRVDPYLLVHEDNRWYDNARQFTGYTAIQYLQKVEGRTLVEAVLELATDGAEPGTLHATGESYPRSAQSDKPEKPSAVPEKQENASLSMRVEAPRRTVSIPAANPFTLPAANGNNRRVIAYLNQTRRIDQGILLSLIRRGDLYETADHHNCAFVGRDLYGTPRFATLRGTNSFAQTAFRRDAEGSDKRYPFAMPGRSDCLCVFESPIDALSHATLERADGQPWMGAHRLALGGTASTGLIRYLSDHPRIERISLCLDNDAAGHAAAKRISSELGEAGYTVSFCFPREKDWNDDLVMRAQAQHREEDAMELE